MEVEFVFFHIIRSLGVGSTETVPRLINAISNQALSVFLLSILSS